MGYDRRRVLGADPFDALHTLCLLHFDGDLNDSSGKGNNSVITSISYEAGKFGTAATSAASGERVMFNINSFPNVPSSDFTVDFWTKGGMDMYLWRYKPNAYWHCPVRFQIYEGGFTFYSTYSGGSLLYNKSFGNSVINDFSHYACARENNVMYVFLNGKLMDTFSITSELASNAVNFSISINAGSQIDELRISDIARWTSDFTPPIEPYKIV
jgi:hypothetical protein